jgi:hypothetical protein
VADSRPKPSSTRPTLLIPFPRLQHLSLDPGSNHGSSAISVRHPWNTLLALAQDLLSRLNLKTLIALPNLNYAQWDPLTIFKEVWSTSGPAWDRLESARFIDHMWQCYVEDEDERRFFLPGVVHPAISFSWIFTPRRRWFDAARLGLLAGCGVFEHASVQARGLELVVEKGRGRGWREWMNKSARKYDRRAQEGDVWKRKGVT